MPMFNKLEGKTLKANWKDAASSSKVSSINEDIFSDGVSNDSNAENTNTDSSFEVIESVEVGRHAVLSKI